MIVPIMKQTPENKPKCLFKVTWSVGNTTPDESGWTIDATERRRWGVTGDCTCRWWTVFASTREEDDDDDKGVIRLF